MAQLFDDDLVRGFAGLVVAHGERQLDLSYIPRAPHPSFLTDVHKMLPIWWSRRCSRMGWDVGSTKPHPTQSVR